MPSYLMALHHVCEAFVIVIRYIRDWVIKQRGCRLMLLAKSMTGEELLQMEIDTGASLSIISVETRRKVFPAEPSVPSSQRSASQSTTHPWLWPNSPCVLIHIDFAGQFQGRMFLIMVDAHCKWPEVVEMTRQPQVVETIFMPQILVNTQLYFSNKKRVLELHIKSQKHLNGKKNCS